MITKFAFRYLSCLVICILGILYPLESVAITNTTKSPRLPFRNIVEGIDEFACPYFLSVCTIFQNEAAYLKEWIEYHRLIGVEHFYLYNNNSTDHYLEVLKPYLDEGVVDLIDWPSPIEKDWTPFQELAYNHCIAQCIGETRWLGIIDLDEFIVPRDCANLIDFLSEYDSKKPIGGIMIFWQFFGTSRCSKIPQDKLLIESLRLKAEPQHPWNHNVKSICKPHKVAHYCVHGAHYKPGYHDITTSGGGGQQPIQLDRIQINHYWTRDEDYFFNVKIPRRERCEGRRYNNQEIQGFLDSFNIMEDISIQRFVPKLRKKMFNKKDKKLM